MAKDVAAKLESVDIDNLEVEILIIARNPSQLQSAATFLTRRGWPTSCIGNLSKAIEHVADHRPDFVLVSLNHPSPAMMRLPELIVQTFNLACIGFTELADTASLQKLNQFKIRHKIFGQAAGPNFHRGIRRILAEKFNVRLDDPQNPAGHSKEPTNNDLIRIRDHKDPSLPASFKQEGGELGSKFNQTQQGFGAVDVQSVTAQGPGAVSSEEDAAGWLAPNSNGEYPLGGKRKKLKELLGSQEQSQTPGSVLLGETFDSSAPPDALAGNSELIEILKKSLLEESGEDVLEKKPQSVLEKAVDSVFAQLCAKGPKLDPIPLVNVSKIGVFPVDSQSSPGYLVFAVEVGQAQDQEKFLKAAERALQVAFQIMAVPGRLENGFWLNLPEVKFKPWVARAAAFNFHLDHMGAELGVAFFSTEKPLPKARISGATDMYTIALDEISTEQPVNFKAYLHLQKNNKYFLYLRNGRQLQPEQKQRLISQQVLEIFMKSVDVENLRIFLAAAYLKGTIKNSAA